MKRHLGVPTTMARVVDATMIMEKDRRRRMDMVSQQAAQMTMVRAPAVGMI